MWIGVTLAAALALGELKGQNILSPNHVVLAAHATDFALVRDRQVQGLGHLAALSPASRAELSRDLA